MQFMVIERFWHGSPGPAGERFRLIGRMLPEDVTYLASWMDSSGTRCYQLMEALDRESLDAWIAAWNDLIEFEIVPVLPSGDYWAQKQLE